MSFFGRGGKTSSNRNLLPYAFDSIQLWMYLSTIHVEVGEVLKVKTERFMAGNVKLLSKFPLSYRSIKEESVCSFTGVYITDGKQHKQPSLRSHMLQCMMFRMSGCVSSAMSVLNPVLGITATCSIKPLVAPEEAAYNLINCSQWCGTAVRLRCR